MQYIQNVNKQQMYRKSFLQLGSGLLNIQKQGFLLILLVLVKNLNMHISSQWLEKENRGKIGLADMRRGHTFYVYAHRFDQNEYICNTKICNTIQISGYI